MFKDEFLRYLKNETIYNISKNSGVERTKLQRIKSGERLPSKSDVEKIAKALCLTNVEKASLLKALEINLIGEEKYRSRLLSIEFLENISDIYSRRNKKIFVGGNNSFSMEKEVIVTRGGYETKKTLLAILSSEICAENDISILSSGSDDVIFEEMQMLMGEKNKVNIRHLLQIKPIDDTSETYFQNMNIIANVYQVFLSSRNYVPNYIYSSLDNDAFLPYYLITPNYSVNFSHDYTSAVIVKDKSVIDCHLSHFNQLWSDSYSFIRKIDNIFDYLNTYMRSGAGFLSASQTIYTLESEPCLTFFITEDLLKKYLLNDYHGSEIVIQKASEFFGLQKNLPPKKVFFLEEGLDRFIETGRIKEIPKFAYLPIEKNDRKLILKNVVKVAKENEIYFPMMIKPGKLRFSENVRFYGIGCMEDVFFLLSDDKDEFSSLLTLGESRLSIPFFEFVQSLENSEYVYTVDETIKIIESKIESL